MDKIRNILSNSNYNKNHSTKIISSVITLFVLGLLIFAGPASAFILGLKADTGTLTKGGEITFTATLDIEAMDKYLPIKNLQLDINGPLPSLNTEICKFKVNGDKISGCDDMTITPISVDLNGKGGYGYGYGYDSANGYGYDFGYGYGYGYGYGLGAMNLEYEITLDTTDYTAGDYEAVLKALIGDKTFESKDKPAFTINAVTTSGGGNRGTPSSSLYEGITLFREDRDYRFYLGNERHTIVLDSIGDDYVWLEISSELQRVRLALNDGVKEIDVNADGIKDISLELLSIRDDKAEIDFKILGEEVIELVPEEELIELGGEEGEEPEQGFFAGITGAVVGVLGTAGTTVVIIFLVGIVGSFVTLKIVRKRKLKSGKKGKAQLILLFLIGFLIINTLVLVFGLL